MEMERNKGVIIIAWDMKNGKRRRLIITFEMQNWREEKNDHHFFDMQVLEKRREGLSSSLGVQSWRREK